MKNSRIVLSICVALAVAFYFAGCSNKNDDNYIPLGTTTGTGTGPTTGTGTGPGTGTGTTTITGPSITQFGITWTFDQDVTFGQFANGDYWVVGPVTIIGIEPVSTEYDEDWSGERTRIMHGSMINPAPNVGTVQGYDSHLYIHPNDYSPNYDPDLNAARPGGQNLSAGNPLILQSDSSLISVISRTLVELQAASNPKANLKSAAILTVLAAPAPDGSFRPPYVNVSKDIRFNKDQLDYGILKSLSPPGSVPTLHKDILDDPKQQDETVERMFERPWIDHGAPSWLAGYNHPHENMHWYGRNFAYQTTTAALMLNLDFTNEEKETLLIRYVQLGIDLTGICDKGGYWPPNGGIFQGRKIPILVAGLALNDPHMKNVGYWTSPGIILYGTAQEGSPFQDDTQYFYVEETSPGIHNYGYGGYSASDVNLPEWGIRHATQPSMDDSSWDASYRFINASSLFGTALAVLIMDQKPAWNHDVFFDYYDRFFEYWFVTTGHAPAGVRVFYKNMWDAYRADYGPVWTP